MAKRPAGAEGVRQKLRRGMPREGDSRRGIGGPSRVLCRSHDVVQGSFLSKRIERLDWGSSSGRRRICYWSPCEQTVYLPTNDSKSCACGTVAISG
jgi:hypothetical protein